MICMRVCGGYAHHRAQARSMDSVQGPWQAACGFSGPEDTYPQGKLRSLLPIPSPCPDTLGKLFYLHLLDGIIRSP